MLSANVRAVRSIKRPGHLILIGYGRPNLYCTHGMWICEQRDDNCVMGFGRTWLQALMNWRHNNAKATPILPPQYTYSWHVAEKPSEVSYFVKPSVWQRLGEWFDRIFGDRA